MKGGAFFQARGFRPEHEALQRIRRAAREHAPSGSRTERQALRQRGAHRLRECQQPAHLRITGEPVITAEQLVGALAGVGGGNFASSMANINAFYPDRLKGRALGLNAGGGNLGVAAVQLGSEAGAIVTGTARHHLEQILELGAADTRPSTKYSVILELVGGDNLRTNVERLEQLRRPP